MGSSAFKVFKCIVAMAAGAIGSRLTHELEDTDGFVRNGVSAGKKDNTYTTNETSTQAAAKPVCACKPGRCSPDVKGQFVGIAQEVNGQCCKYFDSSPWFFSAYKEVTGADDPCKDKVTKDIERFIYAPFKPAFHDQVAPRRALPLQSAVGSAVELQHGPFGSRWIRMRHGPAGVAKEMFRCIDEAEQDAKSALWIGVPDDHEEGPSVVAELRRRGYRFHHTMAGDGVVAPSNELLYYRWLGNGDDVVPSYTTAHEGVGALVLSPEKDAVLLVWEYGKWKMITGNLDGCDSVVDTVRREVQEECGMELQDDLQVVGGWQDAKAYDAYGNDVFTIFIATAKNREIKVDAKEIESARWFPLESLPTSQDVDRSTPDPKTPLSLAWDTGDPKRNMVSREVPRYLQTLTEGRGLRIDVKGRRTSFL